MPQALFSMQGKRRGGAMTDESSTSFDGRAPVIKHKEMTEHDKCIATLDKEERTTEFMDKGIHKALDVNWTVKIIVETTIVINAVQLGVCVHPNDSADLEGFCSYSENVFTSIFLAEILFKLYMVGLQYFSWKWNWLDVALTVAAVSDSWILKPILIHHNVNIRNFIVVRLLRLLRILRILKVLRTQKELQMLLEGLMGALSSMIWVAMLLGLLIYTTAMICVTLFRDVEAISSLTFETIPRAVFTLFSLCIVADWTDVIMPVIDDYWWSAILFVVFIVVATFGILNLIIGVITERTTMVQQEYKVRSQRLEDQLRMRNIDEIADRLFDSQSGETITQAEMEALVEDPQHTARIKSLVEGVSLPEGYDITDCHAMFDRDASGSITRQEFQQGMKRLIFSNSFQRSCMVQSSIADVLVEMKEVERRLEHKIVDEFQKLRQEVRGEKRSVEDDSRSPPSPSLPASPSNLAFAAKAVGRRVVSLQTGEQNVAAIRQLVERLREPLVQLLAEGLPAEALSPGASTKNRPGKSQLSLAPLGKTGFDEGKGKVIQEPTTTLLDAHPMEYSQTAEKGPWLRNQGRSDNAASLEQSALSSRGDSETEDVVRAVHELYSRPQVPRIALPRATSNDFNV